jgi:hypothetical protein
MLDGCRLLSHRPRPGRLTHGRGALVGRRGHDAIGPGSQGDAPESFVVDLQGFPRLSRRAVAGRRRRGTPRRSPWRRRGTPRRSPWRRRVDLPVRDIGTGRHLPQERLDLRATQVATPSSGMLREEPADPPDAERDSLLLRPHFPQRLDIARGPLRRGVGGCRRQSVRHINPPFFADMTHDITAHKGVSTRFMRHIIPTGVDIFEA